MGRKADRPEGIGDWCRACWREYWRTKVARGQTSVVPVEPVVVSASVRAPLRKKGRAKKKRKQVKVSGPTCVECKNEMTDVINRLQCVNERCSIGVQNRNRLRRAYLRARRSATS
jgi:hypothetical protein